MNLLYLIFYTRAFSVKCGTFFNSYFNGLLSNENGEVINVSVIFNDFSSSLIFFSKIHFNLLPFENEILNYNKKF